uniref:RNA-directed DNA polymerase n=1 Tax=Streptococcus pluranimalium TaxID=82348 RepID=UPI003F68E4E7
MQNTSSKKVIDLSNDEANEFFLKAESYFNVELPKYFNLKGILDTAKNILGNSELNSISVSKTAISDSENINYNLYVSKDARFTWRPFTMIHPIAYIDLVNFMTNQDTWNFIVNRFREFAQNPSVVCVSIPVQSNNEMNSNKEEQILEWWRDLEQAQIKFALDYDYCIQTDITDCYPSIYTHSISWALHGKEYSKNNRGLKDSSKNLIVGNNLDKKISNLQNGQTNGIPQGSVVMDFIAEMVLGYADLLLTERIKASELREESYKVLRYRDDYRIFGNKLEVVENIMKFLTEILMDLNLKINSKKTFLCNDIIIDGIKPEKLYWTAKKNSLISGYSYKTQQTQSIDETQKTLSSNKYIKIPQYNLSIQKHLLQIKLFADDYPNSGQLLQALIEFYRFRIYNLQEEQNDTEQLISIIIAIMRENPRSIVQCVAIIAKLLSLIEESEISMIVGKIQKKYENLQSLTM